MVSKLQSTVLAVIGVLAISSCAATAQQNRSDSAQSQTGSQDQSQSYPRGNGKLDSRDRTFLTKSGQDSQLEFATSQLAIQKAQSPQVVQYALRLLNDHADYNRQLTLLARKKGITVPVTLDSSQQSKLNQLNRLQGNAFDKEYIRESIQANTDDVNDLQRQIQSAQDQDVKAFANAALPTQQQHKQLAIALNSNQTSQTTR